MWYNLNQSVGKVDPVGYRSWQVVGSVSDFWWGFLIKAPKFAYRPYFMPSFRI